MQDDIFTFTNNGMQVTEDEKFALITIVLVCKEFKELLKPIVKTPLMI